MSRTLERAKAFSKQIQGRGELLDNNASNQTKSNIQSIMAPYMPLGGDGYSNDKEATATCFCGAVQLAFVRQHKLQSLQ